MKTQQALESFKSRMNNEFSCTYIKGDILVQDYPRLLEDVKAAWIKELRSGKHKQTQSALHKVFRDKKKKEAFCCLGVLEKFVLKTKCSPDEDIKEYFYENPFRSYFSVYYNNTCDMPSVKSYSKMFKNDENEQACFIVIDALATLNDEGYTFKQIAKVIEECL